MKAIQLAEPKQFRVIDVPEPAAPGPGEAVVRVLRVGICGTDYCGYLGKMPFFSYPRIPGHELGVEVVAVGPDVTNVKPGDRASRRAVHQLPEVLLLRPRPHQLLRESPDARRPLRRRPAAAVHGPRPQAARLDEAQFRATRARRDARHRLHAINRANPRADETVLVIGAGPIGLSAWSSSPSSPGRASS